MSDNIETPWVCKSCGMMNHAGTAVCDSCPRADGEQLLPATVCRICPACFEKLELDCLVCPECEEPLSRADEYLDYSGGGR